MAPARLIERHGARTALSFVLALALSGSAPGQDSGSRVLAELRDVAARRMESDGVPGVVIALLRNGTPAGTVALGLADPMSGRPMSVRDPFRVESISKPVTAWGAMRLVETGRLDLDAPIDDCLLRWRPPEGVSAISARHLLTHSAGIAIGDFTARYAPGAPRPGLARHIADDFRSIAPPGTGFAYSDTGFNLLELLIEDCTGEDFGAFMNREIFRPLAMSEATYEWPETDMPIGHDLRGKPVAPYVYPARGSGGLFATADDVARFAAAGMAGDDHRVLTSESIAEMHRPRVEVGGLFGFAADGYGLGHFTETLSDGREAVWHGGQGYGWMSHMHLVPQSGDGLVVLSNSQRAWPLIADLLRIWSASLGVDPVGMSRVLLAETAARLAIAAGPILAMLALWANRRFPKGPRILRVAAGGVAATLLLWPLWAVTRDYLFLFSILPGLWPWLAASSGLAGVALALLAIGPARRR